MSKLVFDFHIITDNDQISRMEYPGGKVTIIPFGGKVHSDLFTGTLLPGAADVQVTNAAGIRHMLAQYMFTGTDYTGTPCKLFVQNNGYFEPNSQPKPFYACPTLMTDSKALGEYLHQARFCAEGSRDEECLHIRIFDVLQDE